MSFKILHDKETTLMLREYYDLIKFFLILQHIQILNKILILFLQKGNI